MNYELIIEHSRNPENFGKIEGADVSFYDSNPLCGDNINMDLRIADNKVADIKFSGKGCSVCMASASVVTELAKGQSLNEITKDQVLGKLGLEDIETNRLKCAMLSINVFGSAIKKFRGEPND